MDEQLRSQIRYAHQRACVERCDVAVEMSCHGTWSIRVPYIMPVTNGYLVSPSGQVIQVGTVRKVIEA